MNTFKPAVLGDGNDTRTVRLRGVDSLDGVTNVSAYFRQDDDDTPIEISCTVADSAAATVSVPLGAFLTDAGASAGVWQVEIVLEPGTSSEATFPTRAPARLPVRAGAN